MTQNPSFGGPWTQEKLDILRKYLDGYTTALKNQNFTLTYVDAFAGSGSYRRRHSNSLPDKGETNDVFEGSASIALTIKDRPFNRLIFIEKDSKLITSLNQLKKKHPRRMISVIEGDANAEIPSFCTDMQGRDRAVIFLDPFATSVDWTTIQSIADTKKVDCLIWFPLSALTRMMANRRRPDDALARKLDQVFGGREYWSSQLYRRSEQQPLFGGEEVVIREPQDRIAEVYRERLQGVFAGVAQARRTFTNSRNSPIFELIIAAGNLRGAPIAVNIANNILRDP